MGQRALGDALAARKASLDEAAGLAGLGLRFFAAQQLPTWNKTVLEPRDTETFRADMRAVRCP